MSSKAPSLVLFSLLIAISIGGCTSQKEVVVQAPSKAPVKARPNDLVALNNAGNPIDLKKTLYDGEVNVLFFYSPAVAECREMDAPIRKLAKQRPDLIIQRVDINRPSINGPDYKSPVAQQFSIKKLPNFQIYDMDGDLVTTDEAATTMIKQWMLGKKPAKPAP